MDTVQMAELATIARLAQKAKREGVQLYRDRRDGRYYASSASTPGLLHYVTLASCDCPGFAHHQHCKHNAALHVALILQDGGPDPMPLATTPAPACSVCHDAGMVDAPHSRWVGGCQTGYRETWETPVPCPDCTLEHAA